MSEQLKQELLKRVGDLDARLMRGENGKPINGAHYVDRNEVVEMLLRWPVVKP